MFSRHQAKFLPFADDRLRELRRLVVMFGHRNDLFGGEIARHLLHHSLLFGQLKRDARHNRLLNHFCHLQINRIRVRLIIAQLMRAKCYKNRNCCGPLDAVPNVLCPRRESIDAHLEAVLTPVARQFVNLQGRCPALDA